MEFAQNITTPEKKPILKTYLNLIRFLNDYYKFRQLIDPTFSYELWAKELGFKSKASVRMICQGKRNVTDSFIKAFAKFENYKNEDQDYLQLLNFYQKARSLSLKKCLLEKIIEKFDVSKSQKQVKNYIQFLSSNHIPVVHMLISFDDFVATEKNICQTLGLESSTLKEYLKILEELDMVQKIVSEKENSPYWISKNKLFKIPGEISDPALALFHEHTLLEAKSTLQRFSKYNQFRSLYFSLSEESYADLYDTLQDIANRLKVTYCSNFIQDKRLFKFNFQLYPITELISDQSDGSD